jgi:HAD superfamily phosphoserine phosphatase-like hydrolase
MMQYLLASDFDQTLSFNDSGLVLGDMLGIRDFEERVAGLSQIRLVQQGAELAYLLLHDPEFRRVRREHLVEVGRRVRLKPNIESFLRLLTQLGDYRFDFHVISAAPEEVIRSALAGIVPEANIIGTRFRYDDQSGEIQSIERVPAGYGKVVVLEELRRNLSLGYDRCIYIGDGSSDVHCMLHLARAGGHPIAVSENRFLAPIARRTILSDDAMSVLVPILEDILNYTPSRIRAFFETHGFVVQDWDKVRTDSVTIRGTALRPAITAAAS